MAPWTNDSLLDLLPNDIKTNCVGMILCNAQPADYAAATGVNALADVVMAPADFTLEDHTTGRKVTVAAKPGVTVDTGGTGNHIALVSADTLLHVTTCADQAVLAGNQVNFPSWFTAVPDPVAA